MAALFRPLDVPNTSIPLLKVLPLSKRAREEKDLARGYRHHLFQNGPALLEATVDSTPKESKQT
jgi:hypothetical protein